MNDTFSVVVLTPTTGICRMAYAQSLARLCMYFAQVRVFEDQDQQNLCPDAVEGSGIAENYERMVEKHLNSQDIYWTHFLSIEDDMGFAPDCLHILARRKLDIVGANYSTNKGNCQRFTALGKTGRIITNAESSGIEEASLVPQGFTLVSRRVYEAVPRPWFLMGYSPVSQRYVYQDYFFCEQARKAGFQMYVDHDVSKRIYHVGPHNYTWEDALRDIDMLQSDTDKESDTNGWPTGSLQSENRE